MKSYSVLVVEDEPLIRLDTVTMLEDAGLIVVEFDDASEAAEYLTEHASEVAAIFTDINLKGDMNGIDLAQFVARNAPSVHLIVTSGRYVGRPDRLPTDVQFLKKPWLPLEVISALQDAVAERLQAQ
jgi:CheY-like chemotaxis protein